MWGRDLLVISGAILDGAQLQSHPLWLTSTWLAVFVVALRMRSATSTITGPWVKRAHGASNTLQ
jgi:hypothetical protein